MSSPTTSEVVAAIETRHDEAMEVYKATRDQYHSGYADGLEAALREFERAPVAPDAEPTEWVWSLEDVVYGDGHVWHRVGDGTYPWASGTANDQRDQDITELVTKHGGRVLVCRVRGIGVGGVTC